MASTSDATATAPYNHGMADSPQQRVENDLKAALKAGDRLRLQTLRLLLTELKNQRIERRAEVDETGFAALTRRAIKQREEAATQYRQGQREELAVKEEAEAVILASYLPAALSEEEIRGRLRALIESRGLSGPAALGAVMKESRALFGGSADNGTVSRIARELLSS
jgi:uncharacterized protein YqeY